MGNIELGAALSGNARTEPVHQGRVKAQGIDLHVTKVHPSEMFWRQLHFQEFEVSEMSMSSLLAARAHGDDTWVALPVFTSRQFFHTGILVRADAGIAKPEDLVGKRVGVPEYQQTAALWGRGVLLHEFGVKPEDLHWFMERPPEQSHGGATGFTPPAGVQLDYVDRDSNIGEMLMAGTLDATLLYIADRNLVDRSRADLSTGTTITRLFPDPRAESIRYYEKTGFYPINHCVVVRRDVVEAYPWVVLNLYSMLLEAKQLAHAEALATATPYREAGLLSGESLQALHKDLFLYGVQAQRETLETITEYSHEQGLTPRRLGLEELFYPPTLEL
ncbi:MAG TPA: PhnD/SsuA/transferrin family substrate-binding protein [Acidimicrobiales bacterium]|nr:PhnD/SsuA/transferrin family substrate-binding protein [Acidimicrobiales bacterium]